MTNKEKKYLDYIDERVYHCLKRGIDKKQIAEWLDDVIYICTSFYINFIVVIIIVIIPIYTYWK